MGKRMDQPVTDRTMLGRSMALQERYAELYRAYIVRGINKTLSKDDRENVFDADWKLQHYFDTGSDAIRLIVNGLVQGLYPTPKTILDFPSGSGRVTRHLKSFFPDARVVASDLYEFHYKFCGDFLGVETFQSKENFDEIDFGEKFDLIYSGSLLTHMPADFFQAAMRLFSRSLTDTGIAVVTLHGRHVEYSHNNRWAIIEKDRFVKAEAEVATDGFGYVNYTDNLMASWFTNQGRYGVTLSRPHWTLKQLELDYDIRIIGYTERAWDNVQDVIVFGKPGVNEWEKQP
jgi:SAM-dependent methyltransferase